MFFLKRKISQKIKRAFILLTTGTISNIIMRKVKIMDIYGIFLLHVKTVVHEKT